MLHMGRAYASCALTRWQHFSAWNDDMAAISKVSHENENPTPRQSMCIYMENIRVKFHPDPIWNNGALGFSEEITPNKKNNKMSSDMRSVPDPKILVALVTS